MRIQVHRNTCIHVYNCARNEKQTIKTTERAHARQRKSAERNERKHAATWTHGQRARKDGRIFQQAKQHAPPTLLYGIMLYSTKQPTRPTRPTRPSANATERNRGDAQPFPPLFSCQARFFREPRLSYLLLPSHPFCESGDQCQHHTTCDVVVRRLLEFRAV